MVGVDGSPGSRAAIRLAFTEARYRGSPLLALMAFSPDRALGAPAARPQATLRTPDEERTTAETALRQAVSDALGGDAAGVTLRIEGGTPGRVLVDVARSVDAQLVVLATRRERAPSRLLGAVSQYVLRNAPCPVLVVPGTSRGP
ncbi:MAG TPA: universal stress protein [Streptosporangiaceae bacterium]|nr:universal stress protein [Streptosporangiaceae bacterium]